MFIGREEELSNIREVLENPAKHVLLYGNRRVGKTTLAIEAAKSMGVTFVNYECKKDSLFNNTKALTNLLSSLGIISDGMMFDSIERLFMYVNSLNKRIIFLIDEYPYLYFEEKREKVDSIMQIIIDQYSSNLNFIIAGSHIGMMKQLTGYSNALFGRFAAYLHVTELDYYDASEFYPNLSNYDKAAFYAVFGGSPFVLRLLDESKSLEENIKNTLLNPLSIINMYVSEGYTSDLTTKDFANRIFEALGNSRLRYSIIEQRINIEKNGLLSKQLKTMMDMNFLEKNYPINKQNDDKKVTYSIKSNILRFYYSYIYGKTGLLASIGADAFFDQVISKSIDTYISFRFENIAKQYISRAIKTKALDIDVYNIGTYYYDDAKTKTNGEFDLVIQRAKTYDVIEVKYLKNKVSRKITEKEIDQIKNIKGIKVGNIGFVSINGFEEDVKDLKYMIDGDEMYSKKIALVTKFDKETIDKIKAGEKENIKDMTTYNPKAPW